MSRALLAGDADGGRVGAAHDVAQRGLDLRMLELEVDQRLAVGPERRLPALHLGQAPVEARA
ncbi:MAG TPA: hypothetical protein VH231_00710 [Solirubrobacteraceae bacterium]|jgi:hypothetical protein|nr:hypothetical protein [Solirubrobacteraceae bacterium]